MERWEICPSLQAIRQILESTLLYHTHQSRDVEAKSLTKNKFSDLWLSLSFKILRLTSFRNSSSTYSPSISAGPNNTVPFLKTSHSSATQLRDLLTQKIIVSLPQITLGRQKKALTYQWVKPLPPQEHPHTVPHLIFILRITNTDPSFSGSFGSDSAFPFPLSILGAVGESSKPSTLLDSEDFSPRSIRRQFTCNIQRIHCQIMMQQRSRFR